MKRIGLLVVMIGICMGLSGCAKEKDESLEIAKTVERVERNIDEVYGYEEPLVVRKNVYNENLELSHYAIYEYDEKNRYETVCTFRMDQKTGEPELCMEERYSYDEYFCHKVTVWVQERGLTTETIYDLHKNIISDEVISRESSRGRSISYFYRYLVDTATEQENYCYVGDNMNFYNHQVKIYNNRGDEVFSMLQETYTSSVRDTFYKYDADGKVLEKKAVTTQEEGSYSEKTETETITYSYNETGQKYEEVQEVIVERLRYRESYLKARLQYEYDEQGRLIRRTTIEIPEQKFSEGKLKNVVEYLYADTV